MNITTTTNKLLTALQQQGKHYKINSYMFYSDKMDKYCYKYIVSKKEKIPEYNVLGNVIGYIEKYVQKAESYNKLDILKYLVNEYKGSEENGKTDGKTEEVY